MIRLILFALLTGIMAAVALGALTGSLAVEGVLIGVVTVALLGVSSFIAYHYTRSHQEKLTQ